MCYDEIWQSYEIRNDDIRRAIGIQTAKSFSKDSDGLDVKRRDWQSTESHTMHYMYDLNEKETKADQDYIG